MVIQVGKRMKEAKTQIFDIRGKMHDIINNEGLKKLKNEENLKHVLDKNNLHIRNTKMREKTKRRRIFDKTAFPI